MSEITIRLIYNLESGKKDIYIDFDSEPDALPIEHEEGHRKVIEDLLGAKVLTTDEVGEVVVSRGNEPETPGAVSDALPEQPEGEAAGS